MSLPLKPGVTPAFLWTTIGIGAASTAASALALTTYAWVGMATALITLVIGFVSANGPKPPPGSVPLLAALLMALSLTSCATTAAFLSSPFGQAMWQTADQLGKQVVAATERFGLEQIILQASARVSSLKAGGVDPDPVKETLRGAQIAGFAGVVEAAQVKYQQLTGARYLVPKNPTLPVLPSSSLPAAAQ